MSQSHNEISEQELIRLSQTSSRVKDISFFEPHRIYRKVINCKLLLEQRVHIPMGFRIVPLIFDSCIFNEEIRILMYEDAGNVEFINCTFNNSISIDLGNSKYDDACEFNSNLTLRSSKELSVSKLNVKGDLNVVTNRSLKLDCINEGVEIINQNIFIKSSPSSVLLTKVFAKKIVLPELSGEILNCKISESKFEEIDMNSISPSARIEIDSSVISKFQVKRIKGNAEWMSITNSKLLEIDIAIGHLDNITISGCSITTFMLSDVNNADNIFNIERSEITNLRFGDLYNKGLITLRELKIPSGGLVSFRAANLGKADFIYCDFSKAKLEFENSKITEAFFSETEFPKQVFVDGKINHGQAQLAFGQLASAFQKQGDNIRSLEYSSREIEAHYKNLKFNSRDFFRKFNLGLNFLSNNFGRDWVRGILFSFCVGFAFFWLLLISTDNYEIGMPALEINLLPAFLKFMNPLRFYELESIFKNTPIENAVKLKPFSFFADFGGRIFVTYGYYQTIQAFRKFGRK